MGADMIGIVLFSISLGVFRPRKDNMFDTRLSPSLEELGDIGAVSKEATDNLFDATWVCLKDSYRSKASSSLAAWSSAGTGGSSFEDVEEAVDVIDSR
jgi:hypothetical protein